MADVTHVETSETPVAARNPAARAFLIGAGLLALTVVGAGAVLWAHYGTAVFFEMIAVGIAACF